MQADLEEWARSNGESLTSLNLGKLMSELFHDELEAWNAAQRDAHDADSAGLAAEGSIDDLSKNSISAFVTGPLDETARLVGPAPAAGTVQGIVLDVAADKTAGAADAAPAQQGAGPSSVSDPPKRSSKAVGIALLAVGLSLMGVLQVVMTSDGSASDEVTAAPPVSPVEPPPRYVPPAALSSPSPPPRPPPVAPSSSAAAAPAVAPIVSAAGPGRRPAGPALSATSPSAAPAQRAPAWDRDSPLPPDP